MKRFLLLIFLAFVANLQAQSFYWVSFTDKSENLFMLSNPSSFLSENTLARRNYFNLEIDATDLPISASYLNQVLSLDAQLRNQSRWLNAVLVVTENPHFESQLSSLGFVKNFIEIKKDKSLSIDKFSMIESDVIQILAETNYGYSLDAIDMLKGQYLHTNGFKAEGLDIGVMDNGFLNVDSNFYFRAAQEENRITGVYNFVDDTTDVFSSGGHGAYVMSTLAASEEGVLVGTAPAAHYFLFTTEDDAAEGLAEEYNWAMAAEMADSVLGIWGVLSTSLGYSNGFNNASTNHIYAEMDGNTTIITRAADLAAKKGLLVVNSAGNEGDKPWRYITAPADGDSVFTIGAVKLDGELTKFSSFGPSADGRIKPNVCALGQDVVAVDANGVLKNIAGTSFSCPITAGLAACLWQAFPTKSNMQIIAAIEQSAHLYYAPKEQFGYGIPNFELAYKILESQEYFDTSKDFIIYPNPVTDQLSLWFLKEVGNEYRFQITDASGKVIAKSEGELSHYYISLDLSNLAKGVYYFQLKVGNQKYKESFVKI